MAEVELFALMEVSRAARLKPWRWTTCLGTAKRAALFFEQRPRMLALSSALDHYRRKNPDRDHRRPVEKRRLAKWSDAFDYICMFNLQISAGWSCFDHCPGSRQ